MKNFYFFNKSIFVILILLLSSSLAFAQFKVVGYMPSWSGSVYSIQYNKLTHINYAFILPTSTGGLQNLENPSKLQNLVSNGHANGVKVLIAVGGWNDRDDSAFESLSANATYRNNFVNNILSLVNQYGLDGVDIDWEYPDPGNSANNYAVLMQQLSSILHGQGKLLSAAVVANGYTGEGIPNSVFSYVDYLNIMAYDANNFDHSTYGYAVDALNYWKGRGLPSSKAILGVPFYGRPTWESFAQLVARGADPYADVFDNVGYNGLNTIQSKTNLAFDQGGGIMIWELSQDATGGNSLLSAIDQVVDQHNDNNSGAPIGQTIWLMGFNSLYVSSENGESPMYCNRSSVQEWEQFTVENAGAGKIALRGNNGLYVSSENGQSGMMCNRTSIQGWETFEWIDLGNGQIALRGSNGQYVSCENGQAAMMCNRAIVGGWEAFYWGTTGSITAELNADRHIKKEALAAFNLNKLKIFPNPASSYFTIRIAEPGVIDILDMTGKVKLHTLVKESLTVNELTAGVYMVIFKNEFDVITKKVIIK